MYGTIFNLNVKKGHKDELIIMMKENDRMPDGMGAWFLMNPDDDGKDMVGVAIFKNKEAHLANANNPDQHDYFVEMMSPSFLNCVRARLKDESLWDEYLGEIKSWQQPKGLIAFHLKRIPLVPTTI